jgi:hypothetical protein
VDRLMPRRPELLAEAKMRLLWKIRMITGIRSE